MKRVFPIVLCFWCMYASAFSQTTSVGLPKPPVVLRPTEVENRPGQPKPTPAYNDKDDVVRISANLIQIDVTVVDKNGEPIRDLKPGDVQIFENGKQQKVSNFSFVNGTRLQSAAARPKRNNPDLPLNLPAARIRPEQIRRTIALVVDDLSLSFASVVWVKDALKRFVNEQMQDGDLVAIIRTGAGIGTLQQFTMDKRQLLAAVENVKFNMSGAARASIFEPTQSSLKDQLGGPPSSANVMDEIQKAKEKENENFRTEAFASGTLGALNFIVRGMKDLPGRKSVILLSDGFSIVDRDRSGRISGSNRIVDALRYLIDLASRNSVVFYNLDARGLVPVMKDAEYDSNGKTGSDQDLELEARRNLLADTQDGLRYLAQQTGGIAFVNQNDLSKGIRRVLDDQSYYLVAYVPNDDTFDPRKSRFNDLVVKVNRPDARVRYRSGFFSVANENIAQRKVDPTTSVVEAVTSPFTASGVTIRMNALFISDAASGLNVRTFVNVDPADITFKKQSDGKYKAVFDFFVLTYGDNGTVFDQRYNRATILADQKEYERILKRGMVSDFVVSVKKPGGYQVRLAIRDKETGKVGSASQYVEIPDLGKDQLSVSGAVLVNEPIAKGGALEKDPDPKVDTSIRQFKAGSTLQYDYYVYNAVLDSSQKSNVSYVVRLFHDGKVVFKGDPLPLQIIGTEPSGTITTSGVLQLGGDLVPGDYILQVEITDNGSTRKRNMVNQFVQFEIVE